MGDFSWLQFSDLHMSSRKNFNTGMVRQSLLDFLTDNKEVLKSNYIFISGDVVYKHDYTNFDEVAKIIQCVGDYSKIFWTAGNHDIMCLDLDMRDGVIERIRSSKNPYNAFQNAVKNKETYKLLTDLSMQEYHNHYNALCNCTFSSNSQTEHRFYNDNNLNLVILNTCLTAYNNNDEDNLMIYESNLINLFKKVQTDSRRPFFVIGHHGVDFFQKDERRQLLNLFDKAGVDLYLCGHEDKIAWDILTGENSRETHQVTCSSIGIDGYAVFSFMRGEYNERNKNIQIKTYIYTERDPKPEWKLADEYEYVHSLKRLGGKRHIPQAAPNTNPNYKQEGGNVGKTWLQLNERLEGNWMDIAVYLDIPKSDQKQFDKGREIVSICQWIKDRKAEHKFWEAVEHIGRSDVSDLMPNNIKEKNNGSKCFYATFGGPATGKTALLKKIEKNYEELNCTVNDSITMQHTTLNIYHRKLFIDNDFNFCFKFQMESLANRANNTLIYQNNYFMDETIYDSFAYAMALNNLHNKKNEGWLNDHEYSTFCNNFRTFERLLPKPTKLIYLKCDDPELILSRLKEKGREVDQKLTREYIEHLLIAFDHVAKELKNDRKLDIIQYDIKELSEGALYNRVVQELPLER